MNGDEFDRLYDAHYMRVYSYVMTQTADPVLAEEIAQETFFRALRKADSFRGASDEVTWLCAIAKNLLTDERRRRSRAAEMPAELPDRARGPEQAAIDGDTSFRIHMALHALEEPYREVFGLRVFGELSFRQVGMIFGKTEAWARVTYHRARLKLQERMETNS
ncbi:MAG: sigma-70 family RNA polymerase sigma factor [Clostridia bacterium]|nr:sigma-70 family RNA polymerase sigma factor [Clostridia bacterium]